MLLNKDVAACQYQIAVNNFSDSLELASDFSYLEGSPHGILEFDFTHMTASLTQVKHDGILPSSFGYQPTLQLIEVVTSILEYKVRQALRPHDMVVILPEKNTRVGKFLWNMQLPRLLKKENLTVRVAGKTAIEVGRDDVTRQNLIPLTMINLTPRPDFTIIQSIHDRIERVFQIALPEDSTLANRFACIIDEAVDNLIQYGHGGLIGGLYYPRIGEVEITLVNREYGFGGNTPDEELDALLRVCEGDIARSGGGGNGIKELSNLAQSCFGTLLMRNGNATLRLPPDGSIVGSTSKTGLSAPGAYVSLVLQLLPDKSIQRTEAMDAFEPILSNALEQYKLKRGGSK